MILVTSMYYESAKSSAKIAEGKKRAKDAGAVDLPPRGEALEALGPMLRKVVGKKTAARSGAKQK